MDLSLSAAATNSTGAANATVVASDDSAEADAAVLASAAAGAFAKATATNSTLVPASAGSLSTANAVASTSSAAETLAMAPMAATTPEVSAMNGATSELVEANAASTDSPARSAATRELRTNRNDSAASTQASLAAADSAVDAFARLMEGTTTGRHLQESLQRAGQSSSVIAGRLREVEQTIARENMQQMVDATGATVTLTGESSESLSASTSGATSNAQPAALAFSAAAQGQFTPASNVALAAASIATTAASNAPATDLLTAPVELTPPAALLAAKGAHLLASQRGGAITMHLEPPALGQVRIELRIEAGAVTADFHAATPQARVLLEAHLGMLRERLESQGLTVERIQIHGTTRGAESAPVASASQTSESRSDSSDARDRGERGQSERGNTRQDAAGGQSRGRRDDEQRSNAGRTDASWKQEASQSFAGVFTNETNSHRAERGRRAG